MGGRSKVAAASHRLPTKAERQSLMAFEKSRRTLSKYGNNVHCFTSEHRTRGRELTKAGVRDDCRLRNLGIPQVVAWGRFSPTGIMNIFVVLGRVRLKPS